MSYPSDLSEAQWAELEKFFERPDPRGARPKYSKQRVVEAVLYRLREGCRWRALPHDFPPWDTVYDHWRRWRKRGTWQQAIAVRGTRWREIALGRARRAPRHVILDSQGTLLAVHVTAANASDSSQAGAVMTRAKEAYPDLEASRLIRAFAVRPAKRPGPWTASCTSPTNPKKGLRFDRISLARRAHLCVVWPVPLALQRVRKNRRRLWSVALVRDDAPARAATFMLTQQLFRHFR